MRIAPNTHWWLASIALGCAFRTSEAGNGGESREEPEGAIEAIAFDERESGAEPSISPRVPESLRCPHRPRFLRAATFNAGLAPGFVDYADERQPHVIRALRRAAADLDLLCVQEFWRGSDFESLKQATAAELPHALRRSPRSGSGTCTPSEFGSLGECLQIRCPNTSASSLVRCAAENCATVVASLSGGCLGCIMNHLDDDLSTCVGSGTGGDPAVFGGAFDVGLLSRLPLIESEVTRELDSYFVRMAVLYAKVAVPGAAPLHVFCTHLGSSLGVVPYAGAYGSWQDEQLRQVLQLRDYVDEKVAPGDHLIVLGDMNTGPEAPGLVGEWPSNYAALEGADWVDPYLAQPNVGCTWCPDNLLVGAQSTRRLPDHVLLREADHAATRVARIFDQPVQIRVGNATFSTNLSDHYGLKVRLQFPSGNTETQRKHPPILFDPHAEHCLASCDSLRGSR